jgi:hypothetical protein
MKLIGNDQIAAGSLKMSREEKVCVRNDQLVGASIEGIEMEADGINVRRPAKKTPGVPQRTTVKG